MEGSGSSSLITSHQSCLLKVMVTLNCEACESIQANETLGKVEGDFFGRYFFLIKRATWEEVPFSS